jgi:hypothetical protein
MAQREQVDADLDPEPGVRRQCQRGGDQPVEPVPAVEADVVAHADVVDPGASRFRQQPLARLQVGHQQEPVYVEAHVYHLSNATLPSSSVAITRFWISEVPSATR